jgi:hypothetical protein
MPDNVNITVNETIENIVINPSISTDVIDVNTYSTTENVTIDVTPNLTTVNINTITGSLITKTSDLINDGEDGVNPFITLEDIPVSGLTSVGLSMPVAFNVSNSPLTSDGTIAVSAAGTSSQYIRGDGQLATLPSGGGGGSSVNYYLNGSIPSGVVGYQQMDNDAIIGAGTDFTLTGNGLISQFLTDLGNPNRTEIPGGAWNFEMFFSMSSNGGTPAFYVELLKYDGATFTSIASSSAVPENITGGTSIDLYLTSLAVPTTPLLITDRLAIRVYIVNNSGGRTATLHTENSHLCEIITTFSGGVTSLNGLTANTQYLAVGTTGTDFNINSLVDTHTFNLPTASATNRGALSTTDWTTFNGKYTLPSLTAGSVLFSDGTTIAQDNSNFFWDNTNNRLGIGTNAPAVTFDVTGIARITNGARFNNVGIAYGPWGQNPLEIGTNGSHFIIQATNGGNTSFGSTVNLGAKVGIKAPGALSTDIALRVRNSADTGDLMTVNGLGTSVTKGSSTNVYINSNDLTTASGRFIVIDAVASSGPFGYIIRSGSSEFARLVSSTATGNVILQNSTSNYGIEFNTGGANTRMFISGILGNIGIGTITPVASAKVQIDSTTQGFLPPRMTNAQRLAIATPAIGLMVYCTDTTEGLYINKSTGWTFII